VARFVAVLGAAAALTMLAPAAGAAARAATGADSRPAVAFSAPIVDGTSATLSFTVNRAGNSLGSARCTVTDSGDVATDVGCGTTAPGATRKSTTYTSTLAGLAAGEYVYSATVTLTDGGTATGTQPVTVEAAEFASSRAACGALDASTFSAHQYWWQLWSCEFDAATSEAAEAAAAVLGPLCLGTDGGYGLGSGAISPGRHELSCWSL
jgi:hypothetical protein